MSHPDDIAACHTGPMSKRDAEVEAPKERHILRHVVMAIVVLALAVVLCVILAWFLPHWWSIQVGNQVHRSFTAGLGWGLFYGFVFTLIPLLVASLAFRRRGGIALRVVVLIIAVILASPNLLTLAVVLKNDVALDQRLNVDAPWFRGATLIGAAAAVLIVLLIWLFSGIHRRRRRQVRRLQAERDARELQEKADRQARKAEEKAARARARQR